MTHKHLNPVDLDNPKRVAIVISNPAVSTTTGWPVGFWWAELTHPYFRFTEVGYQVEVFSPDGGACTADAMSDPEDPSQWQAEDVISRGYKHDPEFVKLVENTKSVDELDGDRFDALVVVGGQGPMFTFERATNLHRKVVEFYEAGKVTAALCHGVAVLRYAAPVEWRAFGHGEDDHGLCQHRGRLRRPVGLGHGPAGQGRARHAVADRGRARSARRQLHSGRAVARLRHTGRQPRHRPAELQRRRNRGPDRRNARPLNAEHHRPRRLH